MNLCVKFLTQRTHSNFTRASVGSPHWFPTFPRMPFLQKMHANLGCEFPHTAQQQHWLEWLQRPRERSSGSVKVRVENMTQSMSQGCAASQRLHSAHTFLSLPPLSCSPHCVIVGTNLMKEAMSLWFWRTDTQTWHLLAVAEMDPL